jgi:hypothetical protein
MSVTTMVSGLQGLADSNWAVAQELDRRVANWESATERQSIFVMPRESTSLLKEAQAALLSATAEHTNPSTRCSAKHHVEVVKEAKDR